MDSDFHYSNYWNLLLSLQKVLKKKVWCQYSRMISNAFPIDYSISLIVDCETLIAQPKNLIHLCEGMLSCYHQATIVC